MNLEKEKYLNIYAGPLGDSYKARHGEGYGRGIWGGGITEYLKTFNIKSICDIGCGAGRFCNVVAEYIPVVYGVDIASVVTKNVIDNGKVKFLDGEAKEIPLPNKSIEWITSFDCLEHCQPEDIDLVFKEIYRVSQNGFILSVSSLNDYHDGVDLHPTVFPQEWWYEKCNVYGDLELYGGTPDTGVPYIICSFNKGN